MKLRHLSDDQWDKLLDHFLEPNNWHAGTYVTELLARTGMRQGELVRLKTTDFKFEKEYGEIRFNSIKGSQPRVVRFDRKFSRRLEELVDAMVDARVETMGQLFSASLRIRSQTRQVQRYVNTVFTLVFGPAHSFTAHSLRHTYAMRVLKYYDGDLLTTKLAMGHKNISSTEHYLRYLDADTVATEVMRAVEERPSKPVQVSPGVWKVK